MNDTASARSELAALLRQARALLARADNDFTWSSWADAPAAINECDNLLAQCDAGSLPDALTLRVIIAPTGPMQEVAMQSGWSDAFLGLASRWDALERQLWPAKTARK